MVKEMNLLTLPRAARALGLSDYAVREAVRRGELKVVRPNPYGRPLIEPRELARWSNRIGLQGPDGSPNLDAMERQVEHETEVAEACASGREELARDLMCGLERRPDRVQPHVSRQVREVLERLLS